MSLVVRISELKDRSMFKLPPSIKQDLTERKSSEG